MAAKVPSSKPSSSSSASSAVQKKTVHPQAPITLGVHTCTHIVSMYEHFLALEFPLLTEKNQRKLLFVAVFGLSDLVKNKDVIRTKGAINYLPPIHGVEYIFTTAGNIVGCIGEGLKIDGDRFLLQAQLNLRGAQMAVVGKEATLVVRKFLLRPIAELTKSHAKKVENSEKRQAKYASTPSASSKDDENELAAQRLSASKPEDFFALNDVRGSFRLLKNITTGATALIDATMALISNALPDAKSLDMLSGSSIKNVLHKLYDFIMLQHPEEMLETFATLVSQLANCNNIHAVSIVRGKKRSRSNDDETGRAKKSRTGTTDDDTGMTDDNAELVEPVTDDEATIKRETEEETAEAFLSTVGPTGKVFYSMCEVVVLRLYSDNAIINYARTLTTVARTSQLMLSLGVAVPRRVSNGLKFQAPTGSSYKVVHGKLGDVPPSYHVLTELGSSGATAIDEFLKQAGDLDVYYCSVEDPELISERKDPKGSKTAADGKGDKAKTSNKKERTYTHSSRSASFFQAMYENIRGGKTSTKAKEKPVVAETPAFLEAVSVNDHF